MRTSTSHFGTTVLTRGRNVFLALLGVAGLVLVRHYAGPHQDVVHSYGGNVVASFAVHFVVSNLRLHVHSRYSPSLTAAAALLVVEAFEVTNGFGVMTNVYDRVDLAANAVGVAFALVVDALTLPPLDPGRRPPLGTTLPAIAVSCALAGALVAQARTSGNPIIAGWYADPEAHVFNGRYWVSPTYSAPYDEQTFLDAFSSTDLVTTRCWSPRPARRTSSITGGRSERPTGTTAWCVSTS